jgi:hypothetical protein
MDRFDFIALGFEQEAQSFEHAGLVVGDQDAEFHGWIAPGVMIEA